MIDRQLLQTLDPKLRSQVQELLAVSTAVDRSQAVIEFDLDGNVLTANRNFLDLMGYSLEEVVGAHHRIFCDPAYTATVGYRSFWTRLASGEFAGGEFKRIAKDGRPVWLQATYNPVLDTDGRPVKVVKFASDVTDAKLRSADADGKVAAIDRSLGVIEFGVDGTILSANRNMLELIGYSAAEVVGEHHSMLCDPALAATDEYRTFWDRLAAGRYESGEFKRVAKGGRELWLQATYNPILDADGRTVKVVKFASDITASKLQSVEVAGKLEAVERAQAVIEFDLEGIVLAANDNFLKTIGYSLREIVGKHHSMFCTEEYTHSEEYRSFWLRLSKGEFIRGRFHRVGNYGRDVHIQAAYNPILDVEGRPTKIVKYAFDVTAEVARERQVVESAAAMTEAVQDLANSIEEISECSTTALTVARETQDNAEYGVGALRASLESIALLERSSHSIGEIVRVMAEIASQTNLLAFNASIEAARAGDHGVGFSVVAGEVRQLAERSSEAAQQISALVDDSTAQVQEGAEVSRRAGAAFGKIVDSATRASEAIKKISTSTAFQQEASRHVTDLITQLTATDA